MGTQVKQKSKSGERVNPARDIEALPPGTRSIVRTCEILNLLGNSSEGVTVTEVGKALRLPKSSAHRYLNVLELQRFVERDQKRRYRLGNGVLSLQSRQTELLVQRAQPFMEALRDRYNETVNLGVLSRNRIVYLAVLESTKSVRHVVRKGEEDFVHSTALGKAIAANLSERDVLELLARTGMERMTTKTITELALLMRELATVRSNGYAIDDGENEEEARCVAVSIPQLNLPAAISVSGVASRFPLSLVPEVAESLMQSAAEISGISASALPKDDPKAPGQPVKSKRKKRSKKS